jgi:hypothetical protein
VTRSNACRARLHVIHRVPAPPCPCMLAQDVKTLTSTQTRTLHHSCLCSGSIANGGSVLDMGVQGGHQHPELLAPRRKIVCHAYGAWRNLSRICVQQLCCYVSGPCVDSGLHGKPSQLEGDDSMCSFKHREWLCSFRICALYESRGSQVKGIGGFH